MPTNYDTWKTSGPPEPEFTCSDCGTEIFQDQGVEIGNKFLCLSDCAPVECDHCHKDFIAADVSNDGENEENYCVLCERFLNAERANEHGVPLKRWPDPAKAVA